MQLLRFAIILLFVSLISCRVTKQKASANFNKIAQDYIRLGLTIGQYDPDFVDAYYGPDSLQPKVSKASVFPKDSLINAVAMLQNEITSFIASPNKELAQRAKWMQSQQIAFQRRIKIVSGEFVSFDEETKELFGVTAPHYNEQYFQLIIKQLDTLLPGTGSITARAEALSNEFIIPKNKIDTVFKVAIEEARRRTNEHFKMPMDESFTMEYVTGKPWSGYNWYKGNYKSVIQINTDLPIFIERAIDLACHEGYPGHHVYNTLLEQKLYREKGWVEISMYPLFSPQSIIAEGSANYGIDVAFPGEEKNRFAKNVLMPLAGLDTTKADAYFKLLELKGKLNYARNEAARSYIDGRFSEAEALRWLTDYSLFSLEGAAKSLSFIKKYRSYVINYNYGQDMIKNYVEKNGGTTDNIEKRWKLFGWILSNPATPANLLK